LFAARRLPDNLKLSDGQRAQIKSLVASFRTAHRDDLKALAASMKQARAARVAGQTVDQRRALFAQTAPARQRLTAANKQLRTDIEQVLTADQRSWLAAHHPTFRRQHSRA
jgi:Spy/CpxP family protein refolding chaperone